MTDKEQENDGPTYRDELSMARHFARTLERRLAGRETNRRINTHPMDWCLLGILGPTKHEIVTLDAETEVPDDAEPDAAPSIEPVAKPKFSRAENLSVTKPASENDADIVEPEVKVDSEDVHAQLRRPPSSLGFEVLVDPGASDSIQLTLDVAFSVFTKHLPTYLEQTSISENGIIAKDAPVAEITKRTDVQVDGIQIQFASDFSGRIRDTDRCQEALDRALNEAFSAQDALPKWPGDRPVRPKISVEALSDGEKSFAEFLRKLAKGLPVDRWGMQVELEVRVTSVRNGMIRVGCYVVNKTPVSGIGYQDAFRIIGDVRLKGKLSKGNLIPIEILPVPQDYQYDRRVWAVGHNTSVVTDRLEGTVVTNSLALYEAIRVITRDTPPTRFLDLDQKPIDVLDDVFFAMQAFSKNWDEEIIQNNKLGLDPLPLSQCAADLAAFKSEIDSFSAGIAALRSDARLLLAFRSMNRVFGRLARNYESWRLFQIVFIVTQLPALTVREGIIEGEHPTGTKRSWTDILDYGDVLWFRTGGGKTEAYLGLTCCAMLYDRLRGKKLGVTAWLRFPLRMLSVQQLQRAMKVVYETEIERKQLLGNKAEESDAFRLGYFVGGTTTPNSLSEEIVSRYKSVEASERLRVVPDCPACGQQSSIQVLPDEDVMVFRHICQACKFELPLDVSDDEIYRHLPSLVVGTIDKMASVGQQIKFGMIWSGPTWRCPKHGYTLGTYCAVYLCKAGGKKPIRLQSYDPAPALHIQDELHLLQEELGAFAGHYETLVRYCEKTISKFPSKIVAATATIEGFEHQVRHLYGVGHARRFPVRGYDRYTNFYAEPDCDSSGEPKTNRIFAAFRSTSMHQADAAAFCTEILQSEIDRFVKRPSEALAFLSDARTADDVLRLMRFYTTTLNYVGSLPRGSRISQKLEDVASRAHAETGRDMTIEYHSSRSSGAEVAQLINKVENPPAWESPQFLDAVVATNMISHGVDLERINLMVMDGVPEETAEYIQASSRSGRKHVGLVVVVLPSYSLRASSLYHRFREYHQHLDRLVSPVPVNRFAKYAARRTLSGIAIGVIYGRYAAQSGNSNAKLRHEALALMDSVTQSGFLAELKRVYALGTQTYEASLERGLEETLANEFEKVYLSIHSSQERNVKDAVRPSPMTSLRDVEAGVPFQPDVDYRLLQWLRSGRG